MHIIKHTGYELSDEVDVVQPALKFSHALLIHLELFTFEILLGNYRLLAEKELNN